VSAIFLEKPLTPLKKHPYYGLEIAYDATRLLG